MTYTQLVEFISRYSSINRFSHVSMVRPESLFNHVASVGLLALFMVESINARGLEELDKLIYSKEEQCDLFQKILLHDADEIVTGDVPRTTKHDNPDMHKLFKEIEIKGIDVLFTKYDLPTRWKELWRTAKDGSIGEILSLADLMSVVITCYQEVYFYSNNSFRIITDEVLSYIQLKQLDYVNKLSDAASIEETIIYGELLEYMNMCVESLECITSKTYK